MVGILNAAPTLIMAPIKYITQNEGARMNNMNPTA